MFACVCMEMIGDRHFLQLDIPDAFEVLNVFAPFVFVRYEFQKFTTCSEMGQEQQFTPGILTRVIIILILIAMLIH